MLGDSHGLRQALHDEPSVRGWETICRALDLIVDPAKLHEAIVLVDKRTQTWPDTFKTAPEHWCKKILTGGDEPRWCLIRKLRLTSAQPLEEALQPPMEAALKSGEATARALVASGTLRQLSHLELPGLGLGETGARILLEHGESKRLERLDISRNELGFGGYRALVRARGFPDLRDLDLGGNEMPAGALIAFLECPVGQRLHTLGLRDVGLTLDDARLIASRSPEPIWSLDLSDNDLGANAGGALAASPWMNTLGVLSLANTHLGARGAESILLSLRMQALEDLDLSYNGIDPSIQHAFQESAILSGLRTLDLSGNVVGNAALAALLKKARSLRALQLSSCDLGDDAVEVFAQSLCCREILSLDLSNNRLTDHGAEILLRAPQLARIATIHLAGNAISTPMIEAVRERARDGLQLESVKRPSVS